MKIVNFGSINIDYVYSVDHFVQPGETLSSRELNRYPGGKGFNQSIALANAGTKIYHAGKIGLDGFWLKDRLKRFGVDTKFVEATESPSGHAIIQVNVKGENAIVLYGGANQEIKIADAEKILSGFGRGDYLLLQNEISAVPGILKLGAERQMRIVFNPAPMQSEVLSYPMECVDLFIVNKIEGKELTGRDEPERILSAMQALFPKAEIVLTAGEDGAFYSSADETLRVPAEKVKPVDTTAAGDTFIGFFLADLINGENAETALRTACKAAALCVTKPGAADSIPFRSELKR